MRRANKHLLRNVLVAVGCTLFAATTAVLKRKLVRNNALDVSHLRQGDNAFVFGDKVLDVNVAAYCGNFGAAVVGVTVADIKSLGLNYVKNKHMVAQNGFKFLNFCVKGGKLFLNLCSFKTGQLAKSHLDDGGGLSVA